MSVGRLTPEEKKESASKRALVMTTRKAKVKAKTTEATREQKGRGKGQTKSDLLERLLVHAEENPIIAATFVATFPPRRFFGEGASSATPQVGTPKGAEREPLRFSHDGGLALILILGRPSGSSVCWRLAGSTG